MRLVHSNVLELFINRLFPFQKLLDDFNESGTGILEIISGQGTGKSLIFQKLYNLRNSFDGNVKFFLPHLFKINRFENFIKFLFDLSDEYYKNLLKESKKYKFENKFDFFYFILNTLKNDKKIIDQKVVIYGTFYIDKYTLQFIEYLTEFISIHNGHCIKFVIFSHKKFFSFSKEYQIRKPSLEEISDVLTELTEDNSTENYSTSMILKKLSNSNIYVINYILQKNSSDNKILDIDKSWLNKKISLSYLYDDEFKKFNDFEKNILYIIFLLSNDATPANLQLIIPNIDEHIQKFIEKDWVYIFNGIYYLKKLYTVKQHFENLKQAEKDKLFKQIQKTFERDLTELAYLCCRKNTKNFKKFIEYLDLINDNENLMKIYSDVLKNIKDRKTQLEYFKNLAIIAKKLKKWEMASEYLRKALHLALEINAPQEIIIYNLADSFLNMNSPSFALEIIKKYSPETIENRWKWKLIMLKSKILMEQENFVEALENVTKASHLSVEEKVQKERMAMSAEEKKQRGLIYYFSNELNKANEEFTDALKLFKKIDDKKGIAAIYNNLGGIAIFKGEWKDAENFFLKSLEVEQQRFNLNGISYCYNNLGSLAGDKSEYDKAINYLSEALKIQRLLNDRAQISIFYFNIGLTYMDSGNFEKAEESLKKSLEIALMFNLNKNIDVALNALGAFYFKSGNWSKAIEYYKDAIKKAKANNFFEGLSQSYNNLGELYEKREEYDLAYDYYLKSKEYLENFSDDFLRAKIYGNLGSSLTHLHRFAEAYPYLAESYDFFKKMEVQEDIIESTHKLAYYFYLTNNLESSKYYIENAIKESKKSNNDYLLGLSYYYKSFLLDNDEERLNLLKKASEKFIAQQNNLELAKTNYNMATILYKQQKWEQALKLLENNKRIIQKFGAVKFLEKNDLLIDKIKEKFKIQMNDSLQQETLLSRFYEITQKLNALEDIDLLIENALEELIDFSGADSGIFCLYHNDALKNKWEYLHTYEFQESDLHYKVITKYIEQAYFEKKMKNIKQPSFAPEYSNILIFPLIVRNNSKGVIALFIRNTIRYFPEAIVNLLNAVSNQIIVIIENITFKKLEKKHAIIREELKDKGSFTNIIGKSEAIQRIFRLINKIKDTPITVLIEGPSGTGKELIARAIHYNSNRKNKRFIAQYCGALPETLLESELFGHVKGAFTGASHDKKGLFEIADGGTFFLDEIADIGFATQAKLLRFLQEGEIKKVGSTVTQKVDVRVICATNVPLKQRVEEGKFREDLYYRLNVIKIKVPSLQERKADIPLLAVHFLDKFSKKINKKVKGISEQAMKYLVNYSWPGNIRQLENEIERAVTLAEENSYIEPTDLSEEIYKFKENKEVLEMLNPVSLKEAVEKLEYSMIIKTLNETNWNQTKTAQKLGLSRQGLIKKMHRYNITRENNETDSDEE